MKRKKLLYIGNALTHKNVTVTTIDVLSTSLREEGYDVFVASRIKNKIARFYDMLSTVIKYKDTVDIVLIDTYSTTNYWYAVYVAKICRKYKIPYIPILHGGNLPQRINKSSSSARKLFGNAHINIAPSQYLIKAFRDRGYKNVHHIPNLINLLKYPFRLRKTCAPKLLWVRSFASIYNPMMALEVLKKLQETYTDATLTMVGPQKDKSFDLCNAFAQTHNLPVTFTGKLTKEEWVSLSNNHDIFINTTNFDNTPISIIEAMALGLPVVSTDVGGMPFLITNNKDGLLTPAKDVLQFTNKVISVIEKPLLASDLSNNGRLKAESFDWNQIKTLWNKVLS